MANDEKITYPEVDIYLSFLAEGMPGAEVRHRAVQGLIDEIFGTEYCVGHTATGAPYVRHRDSIEPVNTKISISHNRRHAVVAVHRHGRAVGIDIETLRPALMQVRTKFLTADEQAFVDTLTKHLMAWAAKEATFKATSGTCGESLTAICLAHDMATATAAGKTFDITYVPLADDEVIAVATLQQA